MSRCVTALVGVSLVVVGLAAPQPWVSAAPCWLPPVVGTVVDPFRAPPCPWCAGNRGLDYRLDGAADVRAAASGRVEYSGVVAGIRYLVVRLPNGWRHTYGQLRSTPLSTGASVVAGTVVGRAADRFFFGLRVGDDYADPAPYLGRLVGRRRLVPVDGSPPRVAPPPTLRCGPGPR
jgi:murein DD-endopeptidase MepM/ murein hydrolase activator NlpD